MDDVRTSDLAKRTVNEKNRKGEMIVRIDENVEDEVWVVRK